MNELKRPYVDFRGKNKLPSKLDKITNLSAEDRAEAIRHAEDALAAHMQVRPSTVDLNKLAAWVLHKDRLRATLQLLRDKEANRWHDVPVKESV
jgi:hypothetical protein